MDDTGFHTKMSTIVGQQQNFVSPNRRKGSFLLKISVLCHLAVKSDRMYKSIQSQVKVKVKNPIKYVFQK